MVGFGHGDKVFVGCLLICARKFERKNKLLLRISTKCNRDLDVDWNIIWLQANQMLHITTMKLFGPYCLESLPRLSMIIQSHIHYVQGMIGLASMFNAKGMSTKVAWISICWVVSSELLRIGQSYICPIILIFLLCQIGKAS